MNAKGRLKASFSNNKARDCLLLHVPVVLTPTASAASAQPCQRTSSLSRHSPCTLFLQAADKSLSRYFFTCLWYSCKPHTSKRPKSCLSPVSEGKEALAELPRERLAFGVL